MNVRVRPSVKATAERLAQEDGRSLANWLERMIEAEAARHDGKKLKARMKKPKSERRETAMHVRVRESVKAAAERLAKADGRSLANWLERMIEAEAARQDGKK